MKYEGSPEDELKDSKASKRYKMTKSEWEKSAMDRKADEEGQRKLDKKNKKKVKDT